MIILLSHLFAIIVKKRDKDSGLVTQSIRTALTHRNMVTRKKLKYFGRKESASTATGSNVQHIKEQQGIIEEVLNN